MHKRTSPTHLRASVTCSSAFSLAEEWLQSAPYASAFCVTAVKASLSDILAQKREIKQRENEQLSRAIDKDDQPPDTEMFMSVAEQPGIVWQRTLAFLLYGGLYQGCAQYWIFNECFPVWFGSADDAITIVSEVLTDQFILTPLLCLPVAYLFKAVVFQYSMLEGLQRYVADAQRDLLVKYWILWGPVQCLTFGVVPQQWRIPFIAFVSFFWLIILSTISSRDDSRS